jgi:hypothetical protein
MFGYFRKLWFTARRPTDAINTRASINISPRLNLEFLGSCCYWDWDSDFTLGRCKIRVFES